MAGGSLEPMDSVMTTPVLTVTERAIESIAGLLAAEEGADELALWVAVTGTNGSDYAYDLAFEAIADAKADDVIVEQGGLRVVVPASSVDALSGATLDLPEADDQGGLVLRNPNKPDPLAGIDLSTAGDLAGKVTLVIDHLVNPMLAAHGGNAQLVGVEDTRVFVMMGGGCHGCSISWLTLKSGITKTIMEQVPEVTEVVDVTDHATGENPYYT
jgi:Fe/S biogenesis protein NfuA